MKIIDSLKKILIQNKENVDKLIKFDNKKYNQNIQEGLIQYYINNMDYEIDSETKSYIVMYNGNPAITFYLSVKALIGNKNIMFMVQDDYFKDTNNYIVDLFSRIIKANNLKNIIKIYFNTDEDKVLENSSMSDKIIYINDKYNLKGLMKKAKIPVIYNGYNTVYVYYEDSDENYNILDEINEYCAYNNIIMQTFEDEEILDDISIINNVAKNYMCIILSQDKEKQENFKRRVQSENIIINKNPFKENNYIFKCNI